MADPISVASLEYRSWPVAATSTGVPVDPTSDAVALAFVSGAATPAAGDFVAASWVTDSTTSPPTHLARILIGPGGHVLAAGTYRVWLRITDSPEVPVLPVDTLSVTAGFAGPLASVADLQALLRRTFSDAEKAAAELILSGVTAEMRREAGGQYLSRVENDVAVLQGTWARELVLPQWPVVSVSSVRLNGFTVATGTWILSGGGKLYRGNLPIFNGPDDWGGDMFLSSWLGPMASISVTYTHGFDPIPDDLRLICLNAAARVMNNPSGMRSETIGNYAYTVSAGDLTDTEKSVLARYSRDA